MSNIQNVNENNYHLVPEGSQKTRDFSESASILSTLKNLVANLPEESFQGNDLDELGGKLLSSVESFMKQAQAPTHFSRQMMIALVMAIQEVQSVEMMASAQNGEVMAKGAEASEQDSVDQYNQVQQEIYQQEHQPWWKKAIDDVAKIFTDVVEPVISVAMMAVGLATGQPELVILGGLMLALEETPLMSDMTQGFDDILTDCGVPSDIASFTASALSFCTVMLVTAGMGAAYSVEVAATDAIDSLGEEAAEGLSEEATSALDPHREGGESKRSFNGKRFAKIMGMTSSVTLAVEAPTLSSSFWKMCFGSDSDSSTEKILQGLTTILLEVVAVVGVVASGKIAPSGQNVSAVSQSLNSAAEGIGGYLSEKFPQIVDEVSKGFSKAFDFVGNNALKLQKAAQILQLSSMGASAAADTANGAYEWMQSDVMKSFGEAEGNLELDNVNMKMSGHMIDQLMQNDKTNAQAIQSMEKDFTSLFHIGNTVTEAIISNI